jgi:hypothetical protein
MSTADGWIHKDAIRRYVFCVKFPDSEPLWHLSTWRLATEVPSAEIAEAARREPEAIRPPEIITLLRTAIPELRGKLTAGDPDLQQLVDALNVLRVTRPATPNPEALGRERIRRVTAALDTLIADLPRMVHQARQNLVASISAGQPLTFDSAGLETLAQLILLLPAARAVFLSVRPDPRVADWHGVAQLLAWHLNGICSQREIKELSLGDRGPIAGIVSTALARVGAGDHSTEAVSRALRRAAADPPTPVPLPAIEPDK